MDEEKAEGLHLQLYIDDGPAELTAAIRFSGFEGAGSGWFNLSELATFADALADYPLKMSPHPGIACGYCSDTGVVQEHLAILARQSTSTGRIAVRVRVAIPFNPDRGEIEPQASASIEMPTTYAHLARFALDIRALVSGHCTEAFRPVGDKHVGAGGETVDFSEKALPPLPNGQDWLAHLSSCKYEHISVSKAKPPDISLPPVPQESRCQSRTCP